jgi:cGMP-dependent protein kinase
MYPITKLPQHDYFIDKGQVKIIIDGKERKVLNAGECFGELALLYNAPRSASIKSIGKCELWGIDRETFKKVVQELAVIEFQENRKYLDKIDFFS